MQSARPTNARRAEAAHFIKDSRTARRCSARSPEASSKVHLKRSGGRPHRSIFRCLRIIQATLNPQGLQPAKPMPGVRGAATNAAPDRASPRRQPRWHSRPSGCVFREPVLFRKFTAANPCRASSKERSKSCLSPSQFLSSQSSTFSQFALASRAGAQWQSAPSSSASHGSLV